MINISFLPLRQKVLLGLTLFTGPIIFICSLFGLLNHDNLNLFIFIYSLGIPLLLLTTDSLIDLNDKKIFRIWMTIAIVTFLISLGTYTDDHFLIRRSVKFDPESGINFLMSRHSTSSLKTLLAFLVVYWLLNRQFRKKGSFIVNSFRQLTWNHDAAQREITGEDIVANMILYATIILSALFG